MILMKVTISIILGLLVFIGFLGAVLADQDSSAYLEFGNDIWNA